ncbi:MAG: hypothetical protein IKT40_06250 [Bacilli bacterium]|nr:hypothetical protein [Bacilli bacterium]
MTDFEIENLRRAELANKYANETINELNERINDKNELIKSIINSIPVNRLVILKKLSDWDFNDYLIFHNDITLDDILSIINNYGCRIGIDYDSDYRNHLCITILDDYIDYY